MKYKLISKDDINQFNNEINLRLKKGWKLSGITFTDKDNNYCQAMTLKNKKK